jgi:hypothetical protein
MNELMKHGRYVLYNIFWNTDGPAGSGKSSVLLQVLEYAWRKGWLIFYIPNGKSHDPSLHDIVSFHELD